MTVEGRPYTGRAVWALVLRGKHAGERMTFAVRSPEGAARTVSVPLESAGTLGPWGWPVILTIYVLTQFCALLLGFTVALIRPRDPMAWLLLVMMVSFASFAASGDVLRDTIRTWPDGLRQAAMMYHVTGCVGRRHRRHLSCNGFRVLRRPLGFVRLSL